MFILKRPKHVDANRYEAEPKLCRIASKFQSLLREIITFLDYFNDKVLGLYALVKLDPLLYLIRFFAGLTPGEASCFATFLLSSY